MAYVTSNLDDEEKKNANGGGDSPDISGGGNDSPGLSSVVNQGISAPPQNQATVQQKAGTGFTNLSSWLDAGKGRDKSISDAGGKGLADEATTFGTASTTAETGLKNAPDPLTPQGSTAAVLYRATGHGGIQPGTPAAMTPTDANGHYPGDEDFDPTTYKRADAGGTSHATMATGPDAGAMADLTAMTKQNYTGPGNIDYKEGQGFKSADMLSGADTAGSELAKDTVNEGQYRGGLRALDQTLFGSDAASVNALSKNKTDAAAQRKTQGDAMTDFEKRATAKKDAVDAARTGVVNDLGDIQKSTIGDIKAGVTSTNNYQQWLQDHPDKAMTPLTKDQVQGKWMAGASPAMASSVINSDQAGQLSALDNLLGTNKAITKGGAFQGGHYGVNNKDKPVGDDAVNEIGDLLDAESSPQFQTALRMMPGRLKGKGRMPDEQLERILANYSPDSSQRETQGRVRSSGNPTSRRRNGCSQDRRGKTGAWRGRRRNLRQC